MNPEEKRDLPSVSLDKAETTVHGHSAVHFDLKDMDQNGIGSADVVRSSGHVFTVHDLLINEDKRGEGYGSAFLREMEKWALEESEAEGAALMQLVIEPEDKGRMMDTISFYKKNGYKVSPGSVFATKAVVKEDFI